MSKIYTSLPLVYIEPTLTRFLKSGMKQKPLTIDELRDLINKGEAKDPLVFLEAVMNGQDPRGLSRLYKLVTDIQEFNNGEPDPSDWAEVIDLVMSDFKFRGVILGESIAAAKTLSEYLYPKRKQVDIGGSQGGSGDIQNNPLTEEEIELFKERFNDEF